jgi:hypothetical protein
VSTKFTTFANEEYTPVSSKQTSVSSFTLSSFSKPPENKLINIENTDNAVKKKIVENAGKKKNVQKAGKNNPKETNKMIFKPLVQNSTKLSVAERIK